ncbi:9834_t:CDS:2, partial [Paraglomus brasilianum]
IGANISVKDYNTFRWVNRKVYMVDMPYRVHEEISSKSPTAVSLQLVVFLDEFDKLYSANPAICDEFLEAICTIKHGLYGKTIIHAMVAIGTFAIPSCGYV